MDNPVLEARNWLTSAELVDLAQAWGPILSGWMDETYKPTFTNASLAEKLSTYDQMLESYAAAAKKVLEGEKFAKLKERFAEMRLAAIKEMETPEE